MNTDNNASAASPADLTKPATKSRLVRRDPRPLALEQRFMFDGAAAGDAAHALTAHAAEAPAPAHLDTPLAELFAPATQATAAAHCFAPAAAALPALAQAERDAERLIGQFLQRADAIPRLQSLFNGGRDATSPAWLEQAGAALDALHADRLAVRVELRSNTELQGAMGSFAAGGPDGAPVIYLNADWAEHANAEALTRVLVEEFGHRIDVAVNGARDTAGDEGEAFAASVMHLDLSDGERARIAAEDDHASLLIDGHAVEVEQAALTFNQVFKVTPTSLSVEANGFTTAASALVGTNFRFADGSPNDPLFSGNNVTGTITYLDAAGTRQSITGVASRLVKTGATINGVYFYVPGADGVVGTGDDAAYVLRLNNNFTFAGNTFYGTSSDPVDTGLNKFVTPNSAPVAVNDSATLLEDGSVSGNLLTNDSDLNNDILSVTAFSVGGSAGVLGTPKSIAGVGSLTVNADGSYSFTPLANYAGAVPLVTYATSDGKASVGASLSIAITAINDAPAGADKTISATENQYYTFSAADFGFGDASDSPANSLQSVVITTLPAAGSLTLNGVAVSAGQEVTLATLSTLKFQAALDHSGTAYASFTFQVRDNGGTANGGVNLDQSPNTITFNVANVNNAPVAVLDTAAAVEAGGIANAAAGTDPSGNVLTNDTDPDVTDGYTDPKTVASASSAVTATTVVATNTAIVGSYGTLTISASGAYTYAVNNSNAAVQALRLSANTLSESFTYTMKDNAGLTSSAKLTVTIAGANDAPVGVNDYALAISSSVTAAKVNPGGNVLSNDTDVDSGDGKTVVSANKGSTLSSPTSLGAGTSVQGDETRTYTSFVVQGAGTVSAGDAVTGVGVPASTTVLSVTNVSGTKTVTLSSASSLSAAEVLVIGGNNITVGTLGTADASIIAVTSPVGGSISSGMTVSGTGIQSGTTVTSSVTSSGYTFVTLSKTVSGTLGTDLVFGSTGTAIAGDYGTLLLKPDGSYTYTVTATPAGTVTDTFTYQMQDTAGAASTAVLSVRIDVSNVAPPTAVADTASITENSATVAASAPGVLSNDTASSGTKSVAAAWTADSALTTVTAGGVTITGRYGSLLIKTDGSYTYTLSNGNSSVDALQAGQSLTEQFLYRMTDGGGGFAVSTLTVAINGANDAPVAGADTASAIEAGGSANATIGYDPSGNVLLNDSDSDAGDSKTVSAVTGLAAGTVGSAVNGSYGALTLNADGSYSYAVNNSNASVQALGAGATLTDTFTYTVRDTAGLISSSTLTITINGANDTPLNTVPGSSPSFAEGASGSVAGVSVNDYESGTLSVKLTVLNGTVSATASGAGFASVGAGTPGSADLTLTGTQAQINASLATLSYTGGAYFSGVDTLTIVTTDSGGLLDVDTLDITVTPDARALTLSAIRVNEASPYAVFSVGGAAGQRVTLALGAGTATAGSDYLANLEYYNGSAWVAYDGSPAAIPAGASALLVRVAILPDTVNEGDETFTLTASNTAGAGVTRSATIDDAGGGTKYTGAVSGGAPVTDATNLDDDRPFTVSSVEVNEKSPYAVFQVGGVSGQLLTLALANGSASDLDHGTGLEYWNGSAWSTYSAPVTMSGATLLVRVAITDDAVYEGRETFGLTATNSGGVSTLGTAGINDDGTGSVFIAGNHSGTPDSTGSDYPAALDDDRSLAVSSPLVNEASNYAVFTITGDPGQSLTLALIEDAPASGKANIDETQTLQVWNGSAWVAYSAAALPALGVDGKLLVRVDIRAEQDDAYEGAETFRLSATLSGRSALEGTATIMDDGSGVIYSGNVSGTPYSLGGAVVGTSYTPDTSAGTDDDRPLTIAPISVNEGSPYAVFTIGGVAGQQLRLALGNTATSADTDATLGTDTHNAGTGVPLQYYNGTAWVDYSPASLIAIPAGDALLVRTAITNDATYEGAETFTLNATNTGNTAFTGIATIHDDGTGTLYTGGVTGGTPDTGGGALDDDTPVLSTADKTVTIDEDHSYTFATGDFGFNVNYSDSLTAVKIATLPLHGTLKLNDVLVTAGDLVTAADITAGKLVFAPEANANGSDYADFTFSVKGSSDTLSAAKTVTVNVTPVDDASVLAPDNVAVSKDNPASGNVLTNDSDIDNTLSVTSFTVGGVSHNAGDSVTLSGKGDLTINADGSYTFTPLAGWSGVVPQVSYLTNTGSSSTLDIVVSAVPVITSGQSFDYAENQSADAVVGTVVGADAANFRFTNAGGTPGATSSDGYFHIASDGKISITSAGIAAGVAQNDYETGANSFTYAVQCSDADGNWSAAVDIALNVTDLDDTAPVVTASQSFDYAENQSGNAVVATVAATDAVGVTGFRFTNAGGTPGTTSTDGFFTIANDGKISITSAGTAAGVAQNDFETSPNDFTHGVQAGDAVGNWSSSVDVALHVTDVDDTAPVVTASQSFSYAENRSADTVVGTVAATDAVGVTGFRFTNAGGTPGATSTDGFFTIASDGKISITSAGAAAGVAQNDFETSPNAFTYGVQAGDAAGNWSSSVDVALHVTDLDDTAPVISADQSFSYAENQNADAVVGTVAATGAVGVTGFRFTNPEGTPGATSTDGFFTIASDGKISITSAGVAAGVAQNDFETSPNDFTYGVQASDAAGHWSAAVDVALHVTDLDDTAPVISADQSFSYAENQSGNAVVGTVAATDAVGVTGFRFTNPEGTPGATSTDGFFTIASDGKISITSAGVVAGVAQNDFETSPNAFTYGVQAGDAAGNWSSSVDVALHVTDLDDTAPVVTAGQSFDYPENQGAGAVVATVQASDAVGVTAFRFTNPEGTPGTTSSDGFFTIASDGKISITSAGAAAGVAQNDFETSPNAFTYGVQAGDDAGHWSAAVDVALHVTDGDDTAPVVSAGQSFDYAENQSADAVVASVVAHDSVGVTGFRFTNSGGTPGATSRDGYFNIGSDGKIRITSAGVAAGVAQNDFETSPNDFTYGVQAGDADGNWSASVDVALHVTDLDDTAPVVTAGQSFDYAENQSADAVVATVLATDAGGVTAFRFANAGGTPGTTSSDGFFTIAADGKIGITSAGVAAGVAQNDFETGANSFTYAVEAGDAAGHWSNAAEVTLNVTNVNEAAVIGGVNTGAVTEDLNVADGKLAATGALTVSDVDAGQSHFLTGAGDIVASSGALGSLALTESGAWTYTVSNEATQYLRTGDSKTETFTVKSVDGTTRDITITINGVDEPGLNVSSPTVSEASPYAVFTITGGGPAPGQVLTLALQATANDSGNATLGTDTGSALQYYNGTSWVAYSNSVAMTDSTLLVRVAINNDAIYEGAETFKLVVANADRVSSSGVATIVDDGSSGNVYLADSHSGSASAGTADDDRPTLSITSITLSEASPYATVSVSLSELSAVAVTFHPQLESDSATVGVDTGSAIEYYNGSAWVSASAGVTIAAGSRSVLLRTTLVQDSDFTEGTERFHIKTGAVTGPVRNAAGATGIVTVTDGNALRDPVITDVTETASDPTPFDLLTADPTQVVQLTGEPGSTVKLYENSGAEPVLVTVPFTTTETSPGVYTLDFGNNAMVAGQYVAQLSKEGYVSHYSNSFTIDSRPGLYDIIGLRQNVKLSDTVTVTDGGVGGMDQDRFPTFWNGSDWLDADGEIIRYSFDAIATFDKATAPAAELLTKTLASGSTLTLNSRTGAYTYAPAADANLDTFVLCASDGNKGSRLTLTFDAHDTLDRDGITSAVETHLADLAGGGAIGDLNGDGIADANQNGVTTLAWTTVDQFNAGINGTLASAKPVISVIAVASTEGSAVDSSAQLSNVKVLAPTDTLVGGSKPTGAAWDPIQFTLENVQSMGLLDTNPDREGTQTRVLIDISRSEVAAGGFNGYMKYVSAAAITAYHDASLALTDLDGHTITTAGWYDFTQRSAGGDGARFIVKDGFITGIELTITDNHFGDNDPTDNKIVDPGVPVLKGATAPPPVVPPVVPPVLPPVVPPVVPPVEPPVVPPVEPPVTPPVVVVPPAPEPKPEPIPVPPHAPAPVMAEPAHASFVAPVEQALQSVVLPFDSVLQQGKDSFSWLDQSRSFSEQLTPEREWQVAVVPSETASLQVFRGMGDQFGERGVPGKFSVPPDAFVHTLTGASVKLSAKLADGTKLPSWITFDGDSGVFSFTAPDSFRGELKIKLTARDAEGREVSTLFRFHVAVKRNVTSIGRSGFSEQLRLASRHQPDQRVAHALAKRA
jgi:VCBS repeat-containing protein